MKCPHCPDVHLVMADRQGIEIDYCPTCRGVWLDRGELDKLIERSAAAALPAPSRSQVPAPAPTAPQYPSPRAASADDRRERYDRDWDDDDTPPRGVSYGHKKKKKSFLSEILDF